MCVNNYRTIKKEIFNTKPDGVRRVGRPKLWWEDGVDQDMRVLQVKNSKKVALDRDEWAKLLKRARVHQGLSSQWWWWWHFYIKHLLFIPNLLQIRICSHISVEIQIQNFMTIKPMGAACSMQVKEGKKAGQTDRQTIRYGESNSHFLHPVNAPKNCTRYNIWILSTGTLMLSTVRWWILTETERKVMCEPMIYD